ncbi:MULTISPECIES: DUF2750 domain-containing protein [unclassified Acinetobacter]|uniref:DUF2750 domain-containing protein n=1 Tax=unclassified Acinetobacter TaxID=196816 RepID=UPI000449A715|nr:MULTISPECIES: DUF2750 domain-containing protein [unclassified Acinetobacter]EZQ02376.1 hypothetical protein CL42_11455 [Acinetobacter sp. Ver3]SEL83714.1 Protein of unknown function [Acinetobacter sp. DSM 11652]
MRNPYQRKPSSTSIASTVVSPKEQYQQFMETIVAQAKVYSLYNDGWALCSTPSGQRTLAVWQSKGMAQLLVRDKWEKYHVEEIQLIPFIEQVVPYIRQHNTHLSLNLMPEGQNVLVSGRQFLIDLKAYLYQLSIDQPEKLNREGVPSPRKIRIHDK